MHAKNPGFGVSVGLDPLRQRAERGRGVAWAWKSGSNLLGREHRHRARTSPEIHRLDEDDVIEGPLDDLGKDAVGLFGGQ